jgi:putative tryptophan/tyrosine transport system substrate-binding protein
MAAVPIPARGSGGLTVVHATLAAMLALSVLAMPVTVGAQGARKVPRIGVLTWEACPTPGSAFGGALADLGYTWGQTIHVVCRSAEGDYRRLSDSAGALAVERVDVIVPRRRSAW